MPHQLRSSLPPLPERMRSLPVDSRGFPVPFFVSWIKGKPEFRALRRETLLDAIDRRVCWICGQPLGRTVAFAIGPMCTVNQISAEPPQHRDCAIFAATACPFMTNPQARRRESGMPEGAGKPEDHPGIMLSRNPGATAVWITREFRVINIRGPLHRLGPPLEVLWFTEGRAASRQEVEAALERGFPTLRDLAALKGRER